MTLNEQQKSELGKMEVKKGLKFEISRKGDKGE
jgi:hypothetical protein